MLARLLRGARLRPVLVLAAAVAVAGCGYASEYRAPADGRARAVWSENTVKVELSGAAMSPACAHEVAYFAQSPRLHLLQRQYETGAGGYWVPRYWGAPIVVVQPGIAPILPRAPVFVPSLALHAVPAPLRPPLPGLGGGLGLPSLQLGSGSGDGAGYALLVMAVIALIVLPVISLWLAADHPTPAAATQAIDQVNVFNDLARTPGSPCAEPEPA